MKYHTPRKTTEWKQMWNIPDHLLYKNAIYVCGQGLLNRDKQAVSVNRSHHHMEAVLVLDN